MFPKSLAVKVDQCAAMFGFLRLHRLEHLGGGRIGLAQAVREVGENAAVFLLQ